MAYKTFRSRLEEMSDTEIRVALACLACLLDNGELQTIQDLLDLFSVEK